MSEVTRREYLGGVAAAAVVRWEDEDYSLENVEEWDPMDGATFTTGEFVPEIVGTGGETPMGAWNVDDDDLDDRSVSVFYAPDGVTIAAGGKGADGLGFGNYTEFSPAVAKEFAAAVYQAAEELEQRRTAEEGDDGA